MPGRNERLAKTAEIPANSTKRSPKGVQGEKVMAEGVVFYNLKRKAAGCSWMAKLRRDMFPWYYTEHIEIFDYDQAGRDEVEDQAQFD